MSRIIIDKTNELDYSVVELPYAKGIDNIDIWIKFVSYFRHDELMFLEELKNKDVRLISEKDLNKYNRIKTQRQLSKLFKKYKNNNCTKKEHDRVFNYMENTDLESFIESRMTKKEMKKKDEYIELLDEESLEEYIDYKKKKFNELNIYDAYVLLCVEKKLYNIKNREFIEETLKREREISKSLHLSLAKYNY